MVITMICNSAFQLLLAQDWFLRQEIVDFAMIGEQLVIRNQCCRKVGREVTASIALEVWRVCRDIVV